MTQEERYEYDSRRKVLKRIMEFKDDIKDGDKVIGNYVDKNVQEYSADGIKQFIGGLKKTRQDCRDNLSRVNATIEATNHLGELTPELEDLRKKIQQISQLEKRTEAQATRGNLIDENERLAVVEKKIRETMGDFIKEFE